MCFLSYFFRTSSRENILFGNFSSRKKVRTKKNRSLYSTECGPRKDTRSSSFLEGVLPGTRIELVTQGFSILCSTTELPRQEKKIYFSSKYSSIFKKFLQYKKNFKFFSEKEDLCKQKTSVFSKAQKTPVCEFVKEISFSRVFQKEKIDLLFLDKKMKMFYHIF